MSDRRDPVHGLCQQAGNEPGGGKTSASLPPKDSESQPHPPAGRGWKIVVVLAATATIAYLALRTSPYLQYIPWMPRRLGVWADSNGIMRNVVAFAALAVTVFLLLGRGWRNAAALAIFATVVEFAQKWIPGRVYDWRDIVASVVGILLAWAAISVCRFPAAGSRADRSG